MLRAVPEMRGILFDLPQGLRSAPAVSATAGVAERCMVVAGDFLAAVPPGGDAYLLSGILHDWDDERAQAILINCHRAMRPGGRLMVLGLVVPPARIPPVVAFMDLNMHVMDGGRERTAAECAALLDAAGFDLTRVVPIDLTRAVVEGVRR